MMILYIKPTSDKYFLVSVLSLPFNRQKKNGKKMQSFSNFKYCFILLFFIGTVLADVKWYTATDGNKYLVDDEKTYNWYEALTECAQRGLTLVSITSEDKNNALLTGLRQLDHHDYWLGGVATNFRDRGLVFSWISTGEDFDYTYWAANEPNGKGGEACVHTTTGDFRWNDHDCLNRRFNLLCEENPHVTQLKKFIVLMEDYIHGVLRI
ncbi:lectin subunit alpha-like [Musca autumnalis]|uniref:lectin subunit alpha-like n=1 Tax=Musca autumnalis TaxID=221902 RepID=UPI003CEA88D5